MEEEIDLRVYIEVLIRNWVWIAGLALVAAAVAFVASSFIPPTYEATALAAITKPRYVLQFDPRFETVDGTQPAYKAYPELAVSDDLLRDLLTQLDSLPEGIESLQDLRGMVEAKAGADPSIVRLVVSSQDPEAAARIANGWIELFVARANEVYGGRSEEDVSFFEGQLTQAQEELDAADGALTAFQGRNQGAILEVQLASVRQDLEDYLIELRGIERAVRNAQSLRASVAERPVDELVSPEDNLAALLLQTYAFNIQTLRPSRATSFDVEESARGEELSPVWLQVSDLTCAGADSSARLQISDSALLSLERTAGELMAFLDGLVLTLEGWGREIETQVITLEPEILVLQQQLQEAQAEEDRLIRTRNVAQETSVTLARKAEEARIAADDTTGEVRLASQAAVPKKSVGPRKMLNTAVAGALGLMVGVFGAFALEWWRGDEETGGQGE